MAMMSFGVSGAVLEAPAFVARFDDVAMMGQPVEHGRRHFGVAEDLGPIGEGEVRGDHDRGVFARIRRMADGFEAQVTRFR